MKLQRERLAASLIVAELQAQAHRVSLPSATQSLEEAASLLMAGKNLKYVVLLYISTMVSQKLDKGSENESFVLFVYKDKV